MELKVRQLEEARCTKQAPGAPSTGVMTGRRSLPSTPSGTQITRISEGSTNQAYSDYLYIANFYPMKTTGTGNYGVPAGKTCNIYGKGL